MKTTRYIKLCALLGALAGSGAAPVHAADLLVTSYNGDEVLRYDQETGSFIKVFAQGLVAPEPGEPCSSCLTGLTFGPDGQLYVTGHISHNVLRYDGQSGAFIDEFVAPGSGGLWYPTYLIFGPDGNLYVSSFTEQVLRYDGQSGAFLGVFAQGAGLHDPLGLAFGPDGNLYVASGRSDAVLRFDGTTGAFIDTFAAHASLVFPTGLTFGPDGRLYVASLDNGSVVRFDGRSGAFLDVFVAPGSGGPSSAAGVAFGEDGRLYVTSAVLNDNAVFRFDGATGAFIDQFVMPGSGGLDGAALLAFVPAVTPTPVWSRQSGTPGDDTASAMAVTDEAVWIGGQTAGALAGESSAGGLDGFLQKYTPDGILLCTDQFGTVGDETVTGIRVDPLAAAVYVTGDTTGVLGAASYGATDVYVRRYDLDCSAIWTTQLGTAGTDTATANLGLTPDGSALFAGATTDGALAGEVNAGGTDVFVQQLATDGTLGCHDQFGTGFNEVGDIVVNSPLLLVGATTGTASGDTDGLLTRYDLDCQSVWTTTLGTAGDDTIGGLGLGPDDADPEALFVGGATTDAFAGQTLAGTSDLYLQRYDLDGGLVWTRQFGVIGSRTGIAADGKPGIILNSPIVGIAGETDGAFQGFANAGGTDLVLREYDLDGNELWTTQLGSPADDRVLAIGHSPDFTRTYIAGDTAGAWPGKTSAGGKDVVLVALEVTSNPVDLLAALIDQVNDYNGHHGIRNSLDAKLDVARKSLADLKQHNDNAARNTLAAFISEVEAQRGQWLSDADADLFIAAAQAILDLLNGD